MPQLDFNINSSVKIQDNLYHIAMQCEENKQKGCSMSCVACPFNIISYCDSLKEAGMIKTMATIDYHKQFEYKKEQSAISYCLVLLIAIGITAMIFGCSKKPAKVVQQTAPPAVTVAQVTSAQPPADIRRPVKKTSSLATISGTIKNLSLAIRDVNGDGLKNCIDYALMFRMSYGDKSRIIRNNNPVTGMNHLFNAVIDSNGTLIYVEPQAGESNWNMAVYWGGVYNDSYNVDETDYWWSQIQ
jgi:hypothetical protein